MDKNGELFTENDLPGIARRSVLMLMEDPDARSGIQALWRARIQNPAQAARLGALLADAPDVLRPGPVSAVLRQALRTAAAALDTEAVLLMGGQSGRMGQDKAKLPLGDCTMLERMAAKLEGFLFRTLSSARDGETPPLPGFRVVRDGVSGKGPLAGMTAALEESELEWVLFVPCDMPALPEEMLWSLAAHRGKEAEVVLLTEGGRPFPIPSLYRRETVLPVFRRGLAAGSLSPGRLLQDGLRVTPVPAETCRGYVPGCCRNLNTQAEYGAYLKTRKT